MKISIKNESLRSIGVTGIIFFVIILYAGAQYGFDITPAINTILFGTILGTILGLFLYLLKRYLRSKPALLEKHSTIQKVFLPEEFPKYTRTGYYVAIWHFFMAGIFIAMAILYFPPPLWANPNDYQFPSPWIFMAIP